VMRHCVLMNWVRPLDEAEAAELEDILGRVGSGIDTVRAYTHGPDLGLREGRFDYALVVDFDDEDGWRAYSAHPLHLELAAFLGPLRESGAIAQFRLDAAAGSPS
jgi:hypothetical protein